MRHNSQSGANSSRLPTRILNHPLYGCPKLMLQTRLLILCILSTTWLMRLNYRSQSPDIGTLSCTCILIGTPGLHDNLIRSCVSTPRARHPESSGVAHLKMRPIILSGSAESRTSSISKSVPWQCVHRVVWRVRAGERERDRGGILIAA